MSTIHGLLVRMGDAGERVSRWGTPAGLAALAALTLVLFQSIFWAEHVPWRPTTEVPWALSRRRAGARRPVGRRGVIARMPEITRVARALVRLQ